MARHLTATDARRALAAGRSIEQWLGGRVVGGDRVLTWLRVGRESRIGYSVTVFQVIDDGAPEFLDIYEFSPFDADQPYGVTTTFSTPDEALAFASREGADQGRFVNAGVIQDEYADHRADES